MSAVQPCETLASPVSANFLVLSQPTTPPPPPLEVQSVLFLSKPNCRWWVVKQVSTKVYFIVFGSSMAIWRWLCSSGNSFADVRSDPLPQKSGSLTPRTAAASHTRPFPSIIELWLLMWVSQICSLPQYGEAASGLSAAAWPGPSENGISASRTGAWNLVTLFFTGSRIGMISVEYSGEPNSGP